MIPFLKDQDVEMALGTSILNVRAEGDKIALSALVNPAAENRIVHFRLFEEGDIFDETQFKSDYRGSFFYLGRMVHLVEIAK